MQYSRSFIETKQLISDLLSKLYIEYSIKSIMVVEKSFYSTRIEIPQLEEGCNGKGNDILISETCAMAELIERLFSLNLTGKLFRIKKQNNDIKNCFDVDTIKKFVMENSTISDEITYNIISYLTDNNYMSLISFRNMKNNDEIKLPIGLINYQCGSNGLSAGNDFYESIIKGIEENFERHCAKKVFLGEVDCRNISETCIKDEKISVLLEKLRNKRYIVNIKDFSLNGKLPVVGVLIRNNNNTKAILKVACDTNLNNAINKCLYELFQGRIFNDLFEESFVEINQIDNCNLGKEFIKFVKSSSGLINKIIFDNETAVVDNLKIFRNIKNTKAIYEYLIEIINKNQMEAFYHTYLLGDFFVHRVYISTVSELISITKDTLSQFQEEKNFIEIFGTININRNYNAIVRILNFLGYKYNDNVITTIYGLPQIMLRKSLYLNDNLLYSWCYFHKKDYPKCIQSLERLNLQLSNEIASCMVNKLIQSLYDNNLDKQTNNPFYKILTSEYKLVSCPNCVECFHKEICTFDYVIDLEKKVEGIKNYDEYSKK